MCEGYANRPLAWSEALHQPNQWLAPATLTLTAHATGSSGFNIAVAVGKAFKDKHGTDMRLPPRATSPGKLQGRKRRKRRTLLIANLHLQYGQQASATAVLAAAGAAAAAASRSARHGLALEQRLSAGRRLCPSMGAWQSDIPIPVSRAP
jgi:hypothetical protein